MDYFGPLAAAFVGIMYARKAESAGDAVFRYGRGIFSQSLKVPGLRETSELVEGIFKAIKQDDPKETATGIGEAIFYAVRARAVPAIVGDVAKATDTEPRRAVSQVEKIKGVIPGVSQSLPAKINRITGEAKRAGEFISTFVFGSRASKPPQTTLCSLNCPNCTMQVQGPAISNLEYNHARMRALKGHL